MLLKITEKDTTYVSSLKEYLISKYAARPTETPEVVEIDGEFNYESFHGLEVFNPDAKPFIIEYGDVVRWLNRYSGTFNFYLSLKTQFAQKGYLSPKQIESVRNAIKREQTKAAAPQKEFSLKPGEIIRISKWLAQEAGRQAGVSRPHFVLEVISVEAETDKAYKATLMLSGQRSSHCCICGLTLTDPKSVTAGIGPICAARVGVSFTSQSLDELREQLKVTKHVTTWFPKAAIRERYTKPEIT